jgi:hypothetical protein
MGLEAGSEQERALIFYLRGLADKAGYAWGTKGIPGKDKEYEERDAAQKVLNFLRVEHGELVSEPNGNSKPPDVDVTLADSKRIGIEVKELVSKQMRDLHALRRNAERKLGLDPLEAFQAAIRGRNPTPDHVLPWKIDESWNPTTVAAKIDEIVSEKEAKLEGFTAGFAEIWLVIVTDEPMIYPGMVEEARDQLTSRPKIIRRLFVKFSYCPASSPEENGYYPVVELDLEMA